MIIMRFVPGLLLLTVIYIGIKLLYEFRASAMRTFALKWGFQYSKGEPRMLYLPKNHRPKPASFRLHGYPVDTMNRTWNLVEGEKNGLKILIVDSTLSMGGRNGRYSTFIAVRTDTNPFGDEDSDEKVVHSNGWTALYRLRFWQIPWTLSIQRIEEHLETLESQISKAGFAN
jgi:hypothetical protein